MKFLTKKNHQPEQITLPEQITGIMEELDNEVNAIDAKISVESLHIAAWAENLDKVKKALKKDLPDNSIFEELQKQAVSQHKQHSKAKKDLAKKKEQLQDYKETLSRAYDSLTKHDVMDTLKTSLNGRLRAMNSETLALDAVSETVTDNKALETVDERKIQHIIYTVQEMLALDKEATKGQSYDTNS